MDLSFLNNSFIPIVMTACLVIGYCIKHISRLSGISNEYIPTILALSGAILACIDAGGPSLTVIVNGAITGLASTGLYEAFSQIIEKRIERTNNNEPNR